MPRVTMAEWDYESLKRLRDAVRPIDDLRVGAHYFVALRREPPFVVGEFLGLRMVPCICGSENRLTMARALLPC